MTSRGQIINQAYDIIRKTYDEVNRLKGDFESILLEHDPAIRFIEQYSYGTNALYLKAYHGSMFGKVGETDADGRIDEQDLVVMFCIFYDSEGLNRISLKNEPELWFMHSKIINETVKWRVWDIYTYLKIEYRNHFKDKKLVLGGEINVYKWTENEKEMSGRSIGYPLVEIGNIDSLKEKVTDRLFRTE